MGTSLSIDVLFNPEQQEISLDPGTITLTDDIDYVVWTFQGFPEDSSPVIRFADGSSGPFQWLQRDETQMIGCGNRGPGPTQDANFYPYQADARLATGAPCSRDGLVINVAIGPKVVELDIEPIGETRCEWPATCLH